MIDIKCRRQKTFLPLGALEVMFVKAVQRRSRRDVDDQAGLFHLAGCGHGHIRGAFVGAGCPGALPALVHVVEFFPARVENHLGTAIDEHAGVVREQNVLVDQHAHPAQGRVHHRQLGRLAQLAGGIGEAVQEIR